jgi:hypothetical protein
VPTFADRGVSLSERVYGQFIKTRIKVPALSLENVVLVTALERLSRKLRRQALLEFTIGGDDFEGVSMISPQLTNETIIDCQLSTEYGISINFEKENTSYVKDGSYKEQWSEQG